ncbi:MAG: TIGR04255 family protein, partial [Alphaproteobacteria bacterium]|nr:TIGR04255 family protein [Alphaproteobacteria bacterium]
MVSKEYDKPPITEAVIDFRVKAHAVREDLDRVSAKLAGQYKTREPIQDISVQFAPTPAIQAKPAGYRLSSPDQADICILNPEGITTSRLAPYLGWEKL